MGSENAKRAKSPRYRRPRNAPDTAITAESRRHLERIREFRFLSSEQLDVIFGGSSRYRRERLKRLWRAGYLDRPRVQIERFAKAGSLPLVYGLSTKGARYLAGLEATKPALHLSRKNEGAGRPFIEHTLRTADVMLAFERSCKAGKCDVELWGPREVLARAPARTREAKRPFVWYAVLTSEREKETVGVEPDRVFGLRAREQGTVSWFMLETDCGTMPVSRKRLRTSSIRRKILGYREAFSKKRHETQFNWPAFRVLIVTTTEARLRSMQQCVREVYGRGSSMYLFATFDELKVVDVLRHAFRNGKGERVLLLKDYA
jgi:hypothetical protein